MKAKQKSQKSEVLKYMQTHKVGITSIQAISEFGATRLSDIIYRLRKDGWNIGVRDIQKKNRYGHTVVFAQYFLINE